MKPVVRVKTNPGAAATTARPSSAGGGGKMTLYTTEHAGQGSLASGTKVNAAETDALNIPFVTENDDDVVFIQVLAGMEFVFQTAGRWLLTIQNSELTFNSNGDEDVKDFNIAINWGSWRAGHPYALLTGLGAGNQTSVTLKTESTNSVGTMTGFFRPVWRGAMAIVHVAKLGTSPTGATTEL